MAKKPDIGPKEFSKLIKDLEIKPNSTIVRRIDSKIFAFDHNKVLNYKPHMLAHQEYDRCLKLFTDRNPSLPISEVRQRLAGINHFITKFEEPHKQQLEELAIQTIKDIYQVPDYVDLKSKINPHCSLDTRQDKTPTPFLELTLEQKNAMRDEIQKRITLNSLVHGSSMQVWKGVYHLVSSEIKQINPELVELYNHYTSLIGISLWMISPDEASQEVLNQNQLTQGFNKLSFNSGQGFGGTIQAEAKNFPVLLHELNKGVIDWLISAGIPRHFNQDELRYYYAKADAYENEFWHYLLGPGLWNSLLSAEKISNEEIPQLISRLVKLSPEELVKQLRNVQDETRNT